MSNKTIIANWKMHGSMQLIEALAPSLKAWAANDSYTNAVICPPFPYINALKLALFDTNIALGGQDCHPEAVGAYTGNVSADMLVEMGCNYVILGHSERRAQHGETDEHVRAKAQAAIQSGLIPVICIGESLAQREAGKAIEVVTAQAKASSPNPESKIPNPHFLLAYEPIWAIGSGRTPDVHDIAEMHQALKTAMYEHKGSDVSVLYGGSVNASNAAEILALDEVGGALVGGASLIEEAFLEILGASDNV